MFMKNIFFSVDHQARAETESCDHLEHKSGHFAQGKQGELLSAFQDPPDDADGADEVSSGLPSKITQEQIADKCFTRSMRGTV
jgi:hypothetical protein